MMLTEVPNDLVPTQKLTDILSSSKFWFPWNAHVNSSLLLFILGTLVLCRPISL